MCVYMRAIWTEVVDHLLEYFDNKGKNLLKSIKSHTHPGLIREHQ